MKLIWLTLLIAYCALIYKLSAQPTLPVPGLFLHQDKLIHAMAYAIMGLLSFNYCRYIFKTLGATAAASLVFCTLYGISDEWHQAFVPGRDASLLDVLADIAGACLAIQIARHFQTVKAAQLSAKPPP